MEPSKDESKAAKKTAKAQVKAEKAAHKAAIAAAAPDVPAGDMSPSERSARAAERQVALQILRVLFALLMLVIATAGLLWTIKPWERGGSSEPQPASDKAPAP